MNDLKFAFRQLLKNPGFTAVAVLTLALGIGANTTIFTLINAFVLKPVGGREPERLVGLYSQDTTRPGEYRNFSYPNFTDLRASKDVFEDIYAFTPNEVGVTEGDTTRRVFSLNVSANYFSVFGATGVESASLAATVPLGEPSYMDGVQRAGSPLPPPLTATTPAEGRAIGANYNVISHDYFRTLGVILQRGREFEAREFSATNLARVAIVNTALAEKLWPGEDALGRYIQFPGQGHTGDGPGTFLGSGQQARRAVEVVGVVSSFRAKLSDHTPTPMIFVPYAQARDYWAGMNLHVRALATADTSAVLHAVRGEVRRIDPALPVLAAKTLRYHVATNIEVWVIRAGAWLFAVLGAVAVLLAVVGVYGVKAYTVARRTREIGIRMALGATRQNVLGLILRDGAKLTLAGLALGLVIAAFAAKAMSGFLFEVQPFDPLIFVVAALLLTIPALFACWLPARRAAKVDPMEALRCE